MIPYLKGIHLTLDNWREGRCNDGWKMSRKEMDLLRHNSDDPDESERHDEAAPSFDETMPQYESDVMVLKALTDTMLPPKHHV
jgi:hypothetical protein